MTTQDNIESKIARHAKIVSFDISTCCQSSSNRALHNNLFSDQSFQIIDSAMKAKSTVLKSAKKVNRHISLVRHESSACETRKTVYHCLSADSANIAQ